jgi:hypothetical protein
VVDTLSHVYSFSFMPFDWSRSPLRRDELVAYMKAALDGHYDVFNPWLQDRMRDSVWHMVKNYYRSRSGPVVTHWPLSPTVYWALGRLLVHRSARLFHGPIPTPRSSR